MNEATKKALEKMQVFKKIMGADIGDLDKYYILKWFDGGWVNTEWVEMQIEYRKQFPLTRLNDNRGI